MGLSRSKIWRLKHPEKPEEYRIKYRERRMLRKLNGHVLPNGELKRPFLGFCEVCGIILEGRHKDYHHWDDSMPAMGIWLCKNCHVMAGQLEKNLDKLYLTRKSDIEREYALNLMKRIGLEDYCGLE